jgi:hypothetical protein
LITKSIGGITIYPAIFYQNHPKYNYLDAGESSKIIFANPIQRREPR